MFLDSFYRNDYMSTISQTVLALFSMNLPWTLNHVPHCTSYDVLVWINFFVQRDCIYVVHKCL